MQIVHMDNDRDDRDDDYWGSSLDSEPYGMDTDDDKAYRKFFDQLWSSSDDDHELDEPDAQHPPGSPGSPGSPHGVVIEATHEPRDDAEADTPMGYILIDSPEETDVLRNPRVYAILKRANQMEEHKKKYTITHAHETEQILSANERNPLCWLHEINKYRPMYNGLPVTPVTPVTPYFCATKEILDTFIAGKNKWLNETTMHDLFQRETNLPPCMKPKKRRGDKLPDIRLVIEWYTIVKIIVGDQQYFCVFPPEEQLNASVVASILKQNLSLDATPAITSIREVASECEDTDITYIFSPDTPIVFRVIVRPAHTKLSEAIQNMRL